MVTSTNHINGVKMRKKGKFALVFFKNTGLINE